MEKERRKEKGRGRRKEQKVLERARKERTDSLPPVSEHPQVD